MFFFFFVRQIEHVSIAKTQHLVQAVDVRSVQGSKVHETSLVNILGVTRWSWVRMTLLTR